jgi:hypothetical protein
MYIYRESLSTNLPIYIYIYTYVFICIDINIFIYIKCIGGNPPLSYGQARGPFDPLLGPRDGTGEGLFI